MNQARGWRAKGGRGSEVGASRRERDGNWNHGETEGKPVSRVFPGGCLDCSKVRRDWFGTRYYVSVRTVDEGAHLRRERARERCDFHSAFAGPGCCGSTGIGAVSRNQ